MFKKNLTLLTLAVLSACGGGGGGSSDATSSGTFINSPTKGIKYSASPSGLSGTTDEDGTYSYKSGDTVTFSLDLGASTVTLGSTASPSATTSVLSLTVPNGGDPLAVSQVLETLDKGTKDGKMDVSNISLSAGAVLTAITNALKTTSVSAADIGTIATGVQTALTAAGSDTLKYGTTGVTQNDALTNLSKNSVNQSLVETKIQAMSYDGSSTVVDVQDKPAFTNWVYKKNGTTTFASQFGVVASAGLTFDYKFPYDATHDGRSNGTYVLANSNRNGSYTTSGNEVGVFSIKNGDTKSYSMTYTNTTTGETGAITGTYLLPLTLNDVKSKSFLTYGACANGSNNTVTINSSGVTSDTCNQLTGATWSAGPFTNTLQYTESNGTRHYVGLTRLNKNSGVGNLPTGAVGAFMDINPSNYSKQPSAISFKVN
jgi:hypothetical protein